MVRVDLIENVEAGLWMPSVEVSLAIIAFCALLVSVGTLIQNHKHNKLSVKPAVFYKTRYPDHQMKIEFSNEGMGTAIITKYKMFFCDKDVTFWKIKDIENLINHEIKLSHPIKIMSNLTVNPPAYLLASKFINIIEIQLGDITLDEIDHFRDQFTAKLKINITYESLYGDEDEENYQRIN